MNPFQHNTILLDCVGFLDGYEIVKRDKRQETRDKRQEISVIPQNSAQAEFMRDLVDLMGVENVRSSEIFSISPSPWGPA